MLRVQHGHRLLTALKHIKPVRPFSTMLAQDDLQATTQVLENIKTHKKWIQDKTDVGRSLSKQVGASMKIDQFEKEQRYELFINKMQQLHNNERRFSNKKKKAFRQMAHSTLVSVKPVHHILSEYNKLSRRGFDCRAIAGSLFELNRVVESRGNYPKVYGDYSLPEMDQSWRFDKLADDVKFGLTNDSAFFSPHNMQAISRHLGSLGYKNTELIDTWLQSLLKQVRGDAYASHEVPFTQAVYGDQLNFVPRHYVFQGFTDNAEFQQHLETLLSWKADAKTAVKANPDVEAAQVEAAMSQLIDAAKEVQTLQAEQLAAIDNIRKQFYKLQDAHDKHAFLQENDYIKYDLLELQELMVRGGYIVPDELKRFDESNMDQRMEKAADIFYEYVLNISPEMLSPQHHAFFEAAAGEGHKTVDLAEKHTELSLSTLSGTLVGLAQQSLSFRRDANLNDYPTKFYEQYLHSEEFSRNPEKGLQTNDLRLQKTPYVRMERGYLNAWTTFQEQVEGFLPFMEQKVKEEARLPGPQFSALRALSACKFDATTLRDLIGANLDGNKISCSPHAAVDGLVGMASSTYKPNEFNQMIPKILKNLDLNFHSLSFTQKLEALHALTALTQNESFLTSSFVQKVIADVDFLNYHEIHTILSFNQAELLHETHIALKLAGLNSFKNEDLVLALDNFDRTREFYVETKSLYDPLKQRVVSALASSLVKANVEYVHASQQADIEVWNKDQYHFKPDLVIGHQGKKLGIFVLPDTHVMRDTQKADGRTSHRMRLVEAAHKKAGSDITCLALPISSIVDADLKNLKLQLKPDFDLKKFLSEAVKDAPKMDFPVLGAFAQNLSKQALTLIESENISGKFDNFLETLYHFFEGTQNVRIKSLYEPEQVSAGIDELRFQLCKLALLHDSTLSPSENKMVQQALPEKYESFQAILEEALAQLPKSEVNKDRELTENFQQKKIFFNSSWQGVRQEVELPVSQTGLMGKSIVPELLDRNFLTFDDYHQYDDWKQKLEKSFDQFNLLQVSPKTTENTPSGPLKLYFDENMHKRRVPLGIFPLPNQKRTILQNPSTEAPIKKISDEYAKYERDPIDFMVQKELDLVESGHFSKVNNELQMIVNLQNVKQSLKADYTDGQIVQTLLQNLSFTDQLIEEHLGKSTSENGTKFIPRDAKAFRKFATRPDTTHLQSQFSNFYLREALKAGPCKDFHDQIQKLEKEILLEEGRVQEVTEKKEKIQHLWTQIEDRLLEIEKENEDNFNLSKALNNTTKITYDLQSLGLDRKASRPAQRLIDSDLTDQEFLNRERCRAESKLIKSKIAYKLHTGEKLSGQEQKYVRAWLKNIKNDSLVSPFDVMVPRSPSTIPLSKLGPEDLYTLNALNRVEFDRERHGKYSLNDLVLELSHFLDSNTVRKIEQTVLQENLKKQWKLSENFSLVEERNKEVDLVLQELEEIAWRMAGMFDQEDVKCFKAMLNVGRGLDMFDQAFLDQDEKSFQEFLEKANFSDKRNSLVESWMLRKEKELKQRVNLPTPDLAKSDLVLNSYLEKHLKPAREKLVAQLLDTDAFGNEGIQKDYADLSSDELHRLTEALSVRLHLFGQKYPSFVPQAVRGIMEHPNLVLSDRTQLDTYCKLFKLDWRGDQNVKNQEEWLYVNPIYQHTKDLDQQALDSNKIVDEESTKQMLAQACQPFLSDLARKLRATTK